MDIRALKTFQTVVKAGSFQQAAQELQYVQSTVTMQIKKLESDLGVTLFHRGKKVELTEAGRLLLQYAAPLLHNVEIVENAMHEVSIGEAGCVRVGCIEPTSNRSFPKLIHDFCSTRPNISLTIDVSGTKRLTERVLAGELDFAICSLPDFPGAYRFEPLFPEPLSLILPTDHPLAANQFLQWPDLQAERIFFASPNCQYRSRLDNALLQFHQSLPYTMEIANNYELMMQLVAQGLGVAFAPTCYADTTPGLVSRSLDQVPFELPIGLLTRSEAIPLGNAARAFYEYLEANLRA